MKGLLLSTSRVVGASERVGNSGAFSTMSNTSGDLADRTCYFTWTKL